MSRNRRNESAAVRFGPLVKVFLLCAFIGGSGVGYVWQKNQIYELGRMIKQCELKLDELRRQNKLRSDTLAQLRSPAALDARVRDLRLNLAAPRQNQILQLPEWRPSPRTPRRKPVRPAPRRSRERNDFSANPEFFAAVRVRWPCQRNTGPMRAVGDL
ncbi:MAG: hypothetical protein HC814_08150 [Rhodobacteraceae bacterium]|nr:hypothetical protein [Paracoccaceae bacterium]